MSLQFIDPVKFVPLEIYMQAVDYFVKKYKELRGLKGIIQFGSVGNPGISDLDLLFIFEDGVRCEITGLENLPAEYKYLFTHGIMGISESLFRKNIHQTLGHNYMLKWANGFELGDLDGNRTPEETAALEIQTAMEFLLANQLDLKVQLTYKIVKLRALLQHVKGMLYDLEFLNVKQGELTSEIHELKGWMDAWFDKQVSDSQIEGWLLKFYSTLTDFNQEIFNKYKIYFPKLENYVVARNLRLYNGSSLKLVHNGLILPPVFSFIGRKYFNLQNRLNFFECTVPMEHENKPQIIKDRFEFLKEMKDYNRKYLPNFMTITPSINSKLI